MLVAALDTATLTLSCALVEVDGDGVRLVAERTDTAITKAGPASPPRPAHAPAEPRPAAPTLRPGGGHSVRLPGALSDLLLADGRRLPDVEG